MGGYEEQILDGKSWNIEGPLEGKDKTLLVLLSIHSMAMGNLLSSVYLN